MKLHRGTGPKHDRAHSDTYLWRRFELVEKDPKLVSELYALLDRIDLSRRDLALIILSLRVRPGFDLQSFDI